ncbi:MAG: GIY-YIG nuclease family protein [Sphingobium sp.]
MTNAPLYRIADVRRDKSVLPVARGVYALYFDRAPGPAPMDGCLVRDGGSLLYIGTAGADLRLNGTLRKRLGDNHLGGNERRSTLCHTLAALLPAMAGPALGRMEKGRIKLHTSSDGAQALRQWMDDHVAVCWTAFPRPGDLEEALIELHRPPLNIEFSAHPFAMQLSALRDGRRLACLQVMR